MYGKVDPVQGHVGLSKSRGGNSPRMIAVLRLHRGAVLAGQISDGTLQTTVYEMGQYPIVWMSVCTTCRSINQAVSSTATSVHSG